MSSILEEALKFQEQFGVDLTFDFITGREFIIKKNNTTIATDSNIIKPQDKTDNLGDKIKKENNNIKNNTNEYFEKAQKTKQDIENIQTFDEIIKKINNFTGCNLKRYSNNDVIFDGDYKAKVMLIGEAPGETEDLQGIPFCGQSGQLLRKAIKFINLSTNKNNLFITNCIYWRPPMNRKPEPYEIMSCLPFCYKMIEIINPKIIILCGSTAVSTFLQTNKKLSELVGTFNDLQNHDFLNISHKIPTFSIYHPSYLLRNPSMKKIFWKHLLLLKEYLVKNQLV